MTKVRLGIIGLGNMGCSHARSFVSGKIPRGELVAVCDPTPAHFAEFSEARPFSDVHGLITSGVVDAVIIATPHYSHTTVGMEALQAGLHVLVEKPISAHKSDAERLIAAHTDPDTVFAAMFNQRTNPLFLKLRNLLQNGELGEIRRIHWTTTNWFRTQAYYDSGGWRATWGGEGGGVLLNQCPHQLDLWQWLFGMPARVRAFCHIGRYHNIEVEDDVTAYMEYANGATGTFIASTGEAPGTNRLEVVGDLGKIVVENDNLHFTRNEVSMRDFCQTNPGRFSKPTVWNIHIPVSGGAGPQHVGIINNFTTAILDGEPLVAPAAEGLKSVELANAMLLSSFEDRTVDLPLDGLHYETVLQDWIASSRIVKTVRQSDVSDDFANSFSS